MRRSERTRAAPAARSDQSGFATVWALTWMGLCAAVGWIAMLAAAAVAAQHHVDGSADLTALAGAWALESGGDACAAAGQTAGGNSVRLLSCSVRVNDVLVSVEDTLRLPMGLTRMLVSTARAGPEDLRQSGG